MFRINAFVNSHCLNSDQYVAILFTGLNLLYQLTIDIHICFIN